MTKNTKRGFAGKRMAMVAMLTAVYVALSTLAIVVGGMKLTFEHLPVIICAVIFGPVDGMLVGGLGEFINQMMTYGLTPTTLLWMAPALVRGLSMGLGAKLLDRHLGRSALLNQRFPVALLIYSVVTGLVCAGINTFTLYVDSRMFGYYSYALVFGALWFRILAAVITSVAMVMAAKPVVNALNKSNMI